jgi:hypothetical protein
MEILKISRMAILEGSVGLVLKKKNTPAEEI